MDTMSEEYVLTRMPGFPIPSIFKEKYKFINNIDEVDETYNGKQVIILYKYSKKIVGMNYKDFIYKGYLVYSQIKEDDYKNYIWINDNRLIKTIQLSKNRFSKKNYDLEMYIHL
jgi:hypothetical protein